MKRLFAFAASVAAAVAMSATLAACGGSAEGEYRLKSITAEGAGFSLSLTAEEPISLGGLSFTVHSDAFVLTLGQDNKFTLDSQLLGLGYIEGDWVAEGDNIQFTTGNFGYIAEHRGNTLVLTPETQPSDPAAGDGQETEQGTVVTITLSK